MEQKMEGCDEEYFGGEILHLASVVEGVNYEPVMPVQIEDELDEDGDTFFAEEFFMM